MAAETTTGLPSEAITKLLRKLAKQVLAQSSKTSATKFSAPPLVPTKYMRYEVVATLTSEVQGYVDATEKPGKRPAKALTKTIKCLAKQVVKQQRKQAPPVAGATQPAQENSPRVCLKSQVT